MEYPLIRTQSSRDFDAVILGDGDFPVHPVTVEILRHARFLCCCDGAALHAISHGFHPDAIIGDGDSLPNDLKVAYSKILHTVSEQDSNDLPKATRYCIQKGYKEIAYLGATGKREDHTLGNISLMVYYLTTFPIRPTMVTDYGYFVPCQGHGTFASFPKQQVSIFNFGSKDIKSDGLRWDSYAYQQWWQGTLNEAIGNTFSIQADGPYLVYRTFEAKNAFPEGFSCR